MKNTCLIATFALSALLPPPPPPPFFNEKGLYYEKAIRFHRWAADYAQSLIEGTYGRKMKRWGGIVDSLINNLIFETRDVHLRQVGSEENAEAEWRGRRAKDSGNGMFREPAERQTRDKRERNGERDRKMIVRESREQRRSRSFLRSW